MRGREFLVGAVIIAAIAVGVGGTLWLQGRTFGPIVNVDVLTESVGQLAEGNAVQYRGVRIGQVSTIAVLPDGSGVRVSLLLESSVALPADAAAILAPESLFGTWQAEIVSRASSAQFPFFEVPTGEARDVLVVGGYALPELSRLSRSAEQISVNLETLTDRLELAFNEETAGNLASAIGNIEAMTQELRTLVTQQSAVAEAITANADSALSEIEVAAGAARRTFERMEGIIDEAGLDSMFANIGLASAGLRDVAMELSDTTSGLGVTLERADSTFARVDRIMARVESGDGSFGRLLADSTFAVRAEDVLEQINLLLEDLRENPRRYVRLSIF
ncbi:MAG: MlaD family protein [Gemmatimonadota bacterium]|nr:MlaD family protein [Gemmatimonadota bacterium]MDH3421855.1 MlaD family protein [Gemmatimonadota bacterium]